MTEREIFANELLIRNWNRVLPWLAQVRDIPLDEHLKAVRRLVDKAGAICLADAVNLGEADESAVFGAAALKGVQTGLFVSDLGVRPFGEGTLIASRRHSIVNYTFRSTPEDLRETSAWPMPDLSSLDELELARFERMYRGIKLGLQGGSETAAAKCAGCARATF